MRIAQRLRGQGQWAVLVGLIDLIGCAIGVFQYWHYGTVSISPGRASVSGQDAVQLLFVLGLVGVFFLTYGVFRFRKAARLAGTVEDIEPEAR